jgi:tRNA dimethylallyltransferase
LNIGSGKDLQDYVVSGTAIPYHLVDVCDTADEFSVYRFHELFHVAFDAITARQKLPILAGGTGLYLSSVLETYSMHKVHFETARARELTRFSVDELRGMLFAQSPQLHNTTDLLVKERIVRAILVAEGKASEDEKVLPEKFFNYLTFGINPGREKVKERISERLAHRFNNGMIEEVEDLLRSGVPIEKMAFWGLEYKFISLFLSGQLARDAMMTKLETAIHQYAKRQMTWFRRMEKHGVVIHWLDSADTAAALPVVRRWLG